MYRVSLSALSLLQSLFPKENLNTMTLNTISTQKLKSEPELDPTRHNHMLTRTNPTFGSGSGWVCTPLAQSIMDKLGTSAQHLKGFKQ